MHRQESMSQCSIVILVELTRNLIFIDVYLDEYTARIRISSCSMFIDRAIVDLNIVSYL
jgi:hypothetical protein